MGSWRQVRGSGKEAVWELSTRYKVLGTKYEVRNTRVKLMLNFER